MSFNLDEAIQKKQAFESQVKSIRKAIGEDTSLMPADPKPEAVAAALESFTLDDIAWFICAIISDYEAEKEDLQDEIALGVTNNSSALDELRSKLYSLSKQVEDTVAWLDEYEDE